MPNPIPQLGTFTAKDLLTRPIEPLGFIIDTLQYIRNNGKFIGTYSGDYQDIDALRSIIGDRKLTMLLITRFSTRTRRHS